jgi:hypothetical protein
MASFFVPKSFWQFFWQLFGSFLAAFWQLFGSFLAAFWQLFGSFLAAFWQLSLVVLGLVIFGTKILYKKLSSKMLMKLTAGLLIIKTTNTQTVNKDGRDRYSQTILTHV